MPDEPVQSVTLTFTPENDTLPMIVSDIQPSGPENVFQIPPGLQEITESEPVPVPKGFDVILQPAKNTVAFLNAVTLTTLSTVTVTLDNGDTKTVCLLYLIFSHLHV